VETSFAVCVAAVDKPPYAWHVGSACAARPARLDLRGPKRTTDNTQLKP
jgi:hypothetical protein